MADLILGTLCVGLLVAGWFAMAFFFDEYLITEGVPDGPPYTWRHWAWWAVLPWIVVALGAWHFAHALADLWRMHREARDG